MCFKDLYTRREKSQVYHAERMVVALLAELNAQMKRLGMSMGCQPTVTIQRKEHENV